MAISDLIKRNLTKAGYEVTQAFDGMEGQTSWKIELLILLMRNQNITLFREKIYEEIWGSKYSLES